MLGIDLGGLGQRTILSGIKKDFEPEKLIGTQVLVLVNLEPKKMMGLESQGMILMAVGHKCKVQNSKACPEPAEGCKVDEGKSEEMTEETEQITLLVPQNKVTDGTGVE